MKSSTFTNAHFLRGEKSQILALSDALERGNGAAICAAFLDVARSRGIAQIALKAKLSEQQVYAAFADPEKPDIVVLQVILEKIQG